MDVTSATQASQGLANRAGAKLAQDFDTFLTLLTTQLRQQDPLEPLKSNEFTTQLVQFTGVEQAIQTNKNLESLLGLLNQQSDAGLVGYLGKDVLANGESALFNGTDGINWAYELGATVPSSKLIVRNTAGVKVFETEGKPNAGLHPFVWDGRDSSGNSVPTGVYRLEVEATTASGIAAGRQIYIRGIVDGIERSSNGSRLSVAGNLITLDQVAAVTQPEPAP
ncbi:MAG: flagellar hook assembly protein FlgD [Pseudomonadota bacterium]